MPSAAETLYDEQASIIKAAVLAAVQVWGELEPSRINASWVQQQVGDRLFLTLSRAQELAATAADFYTELILAEDGADVTPDGVIVPAALAGVASDGRDLDGLLLQPLITTQAAVSTGVPLLEALAAGRAALTRIVGTQVADVGRSASGLGIAARPRTGWVRLVEPGACSRCIVLAGRWYRWSSGFDRHPLCKCRNIPAAEDTDMLTAESDPKTHFNSLSEAEQNRQFTKAGARAIRDGADISRVVNARRNALGLSSPGRLTAEEKKLLRGGGERGRLEKADVYGRSVYITREGTTYRAEWGKAQIDRYGGTKADSNYRVAKVPRLMPETVYDIATDRDDAVRLLKRFGYIR